MFYSDFYTSPVGKLFMTSDGTNLTGLWIEKQKYFAATAPQECREKADLPVLFRRRNGWTNTFKSKIPRFPNCLWLPKAGNSVR